jgi:hypothetical protein
MTIIPADNNYNYTWSGLAGDPWPGTSNNTMLTNYSTPAAITYNANTDGEFFLNKPIDNIKENTATNTISFVACRPDLDVPTPGDGVEDTSERSFTITWPTISDAAGYEVELTTMNKAADNPEDALLKNYDFSTFVTASAGISDIGSKLSNYGFSGWTGSKLYTSPNMLKFGTTKEGGTLMSGFSYMPPSNNITVVMGAAPFKDSDAVQGNLKMEFGNNGESLSTVIVENRSFEVTKDGKQVFQFADIRKELFRITISSTSRMYMNYLAFYDGLWTAEQLGINSSNKAPRRANTTTEVFSTETNSYTFSNLNPTKRYFYRVRAIGNEGNYSKWSNEKEFNFSSTGIDMVKALRIDDGMTHVYDTQGRLVYSAPASSFNINAIPCNGILLVKQNGMIRKVVK